jgi:hypothetical protein
MRELWSSDTGHQIRPKMPKVFRGKTSGQETGTEETGQKITQGKSKRQKTETL